MKSLIFLVFLLGCVATPPKAPPPPPPVVAEPIVPPTIVPQSRKPVIAVVNAYQAARIKELPAVLAPNVTPDYVANVHYKELAARKAVRALEDEDGRRKPATLEAARRAVRDLEDALAAPKDPDVVGGK
jgi:hypothetical protein